MRKIIEKLRRKFTPLDERVLSISLLLKDLAITNQKAFNLLKGLIQDNAQTIDLLENRVEELEKEMDRQREA